MENGPFEDAFPTEKCIFHCHVSLADGSFGRLPRKSRSTKRLAPSKDQGILKTWIIRKTSHFVWSTAKLEIASNSIKVILLGLGDFKLFRGPLNQLSRGQL